MLLRVAKPRVARFFFLRPSLGRRSVSSVERLRALALYGPDAVLPLESPFSHVTHLPSVPATLSRGGVVSSPMLLGAIDPNPNLEAFGAGVEIMVFTAIATIAALLVLAWIIKTMRGGG